MNCNTVLHTNVHLVRGRKRCCNTVAKTVAKTVAGGETLGFQRLDEIGRGF